MKTLFSIRTFSVFQELLKKGERKNEIGWLEVSVVTALEKLLQFLRFSDWRGAKVLLSVMLEKPCC